MFRLQVYDEAFLIKHDFSSVKKISINLYEKPILASSLGFEVSDGDMLRLHYSDRLIETFILKVTAAGKPFAAVLPCPLPVHFNVN